MFAVFLIISAGNELRVGQGLALMIISTVLHALLCAGAVMPMEHWPTRYLRPISILRDDGGVLPN